MRRKMDFHPNENFICVEICKLAIYTVALSKGSMDASKVGLFQSSSDDSFEHIDPEFDNSFYPDLRGLAVADYIPKEKDEVLLKKGGWAAVRRWEVA